MMNANTTTAGKQYLKGAFIVFIEHSKNTFMCAVKNILSFQTKKVKDITRLHRISMFVQKRATCTDCASW